MGSDPKISPAEVEHAASRDMTSSEQQRDDARNATSREHNLTLRESFRLYPKAIGFSILFSAAIIMEGYDLSLMGAFYGYDSCVSCS
jgi:SP family general alpha glucoside:H+ symporter-like MFS transporter